MSSTLLDVHGRDSVAAGVASSIPRGSVEVVADLAVVIVSYECRDLVAACVERIRSLGTDCTVDVVVVDNGSADGTEAALAGRCRLIQMGRNSGFSTANNAGFAATRSRHVLVLNPDTLVDPGALDVLVAFLDDHPDAGVVAPSLVNPDGSDQLTARAFPSPAVALFGRRSPLSRWFPNNRFSRRYLATRAGTLDEAFRVDWVSGAAMAVRRSAIDVTGGFDEAFFMFWEDADWCHRLADAGYEVWCEPAARVVHDEGGTSMYTGRSLMVLSRTLTLKGGHHRWNRPTKSPSCSAPKRWGPCRSSTISWTGSASMRSSTGSSQRTTPDCVLTRLW
jgi:N-acetylglucosaminyl-diphospho-decaprenol L-rhamnosyltransferase